MRNPHDLDGASWREHPWLTALALGAVVAGIYVRFKGLGAWPLGIDEYYTARAIENVLRSGLPEYACGGWYTRGILVQYLAAGLQTLGLSPEFAPRSIAAVSSLIVLPAAYLLGRRAGGRHIGLLAVIILALSVWEVEMARFARMYAPFQAVFLWYLVFFVQYTVDGRTRALWPMVLLSLAGVLVWEGGALLAAANFVPPLLRNVNAAPDSGRDRLDPRQLAYMAGMALLALPLYLFATNNLRFAGEHSPVPDGYRFSDYWSGRDADYSGLGAVLDNGWTLAAVGLLGLCALLALRWIVGFRHRWLTAAGLAAALAAGLTGRFMAVAAVLVLLPLFGLLRWRELASRAASPFWLTLTLSAAAWFVHFLLHPEAHADVPTRWLSGMPGVLYQLLSFPDPLVEVALPWGRAVPILSLLLFGTVIVFSAWRIARPPARLTAEHALLVVVLLMLLAASASNPPRHETRYVFFLYPALVILTLATLSMLFSRLRALVGASAHTTLLVTALASLGAFALTEDFQPRHLLRIDSEAAHFRTDLPEHMGDHLYSRSNPRTAAIWLHQQLHAGDLVINAYQSFDFYSADTDYFFIDWEDRRFGGWSCLAGTVERWSNRPLLYTHQALQAQLDAGRRTYYVAEAHALDRTLQELQRWRPQVVWRKYNIAIVQLNGTTH